MKIKNIHIDNFGKLHDYSLELDGNPCVIMEDNGWGKSTLANFIRIMFFGFRGENARTGLNERRKYAPWNKGLFGGSIVFEVNGKQYELHRTFGIKAGDDSSTIRDYTTGLESDDYTCDRLGEQIFGLDGEAFARTVFVAQDRGVNGTLGSNIQAKIGKLTDESGDMGDFDKVMAAIDTRKKGLKSGNKKGKINEERMQIAQLEVGLLGVSALEQEIQKTGMRIKENNSEADLIRLELAKLDEEMAVVSKQGEQQARWENYNSVKNEWLKLKEETEATKPACEDLNQLDEMLEIALEVEKLRPVAEENIEQNLMLNSGPDKEEINENIKLWNNRNSIVSQMSSLQVRLDSIVYMDNIHKETVENANKKKKEEYLNATKLLTERRNQEERKLSNIKNLLLAFGIIISGLSVAVFFVLSTLMHMIVAGTGVAVLAAYFVVRNRSVETEYLKEPEYDEYKTDDRIISYRKELADMKDSVSNAERRIKAFFAKYEIEFDEDMVDSRLYRLLTAAEDYEKNQAKADKVKDIICELESKERILKDFFESINMAGQNQWLETLQNQKNLLGLYELNRKRLDEKAKELEELGKVTEGMTYISNADNVRTIDDITGIKELLNDRLESNRDKAETYRRNLDERSEKLRALYEDEKVLEEKRNQLAKLNDEYDIIIKAEEHLVRARNNLISKYRDPILDAFSKYYSFIRVEDLDLYDIDAKVQVTKLEEGDRRSMSSMSRGYSELVDVALRMALVDSMYESEKPFVVMDDPFVNLDTDKVKKCSDFIREVAKEYQVIYFTCHESRNII